MKLKIKKIFNSRFKEGQVVEIDKIKRCRTTTSGILLIIILMLILCGCVHNYTILKLPKEFPEGIESYLLLRCDDNKPFRLEIEYPLDELEKKIKNFEKITLSFQCKDE